jgi:hypothetical protein
MREASFTIKNDNIYIGKPLNVITVNAAFLDQIA